MRYAYIHCITYVYTKPREQPFETEKKKKGKERKKNGTETERKGTVKKRTLFHDRYCSLAYPFLSQILKLKYDAAVKEQEEARLKAEQEEEEREKRTTAAIKIQKCWRAHHIRKIEAKQAQKGKKKGKGKGKGKKKT